MKDCRSQLKELVNLTKQYIKEIQKLGITDIIVDKPKEKTLRQYNEEIKNCKKCPLSKTRVKFVFGEGNPDAELVFVGEAPGYDEDQQGRPFVGRAGQLLTKIIEAIDIKRGDVYICNVLKCRPPGNRPPLPEEVEKCRPYLIKQLELLKRKKAICCLGLSAAQGLLELNLLMREMRGNWYKYKETPVMVTYHPAYLLRNPDEKKRVWNDMKKVKECLQK